MVEYLFILYSLGVCRSLASSLTEIAINIAIWYSSPKVVYSVGLVGLVKLIHVFATEALLTSTARLGFYWQPNVPRAVIRT